jgi:hypothetical protein
MSYTPPAFVPTFGSEHVTIEVWAGSQPRAFIIFTAAVAMPTPVRRLSVWKTGMFFEPGTLYSFNHGMQYFLNAAWIAGYCVGTTLASITADAFTVCA